MSEQPLLTLPAIEGDALDTRPIPDAPDALGIGCIGAGNIVANAHLPSYQAAGFRVVAITSRTQANARAVAELRDIPKVHESVDALLADPAVDIVDIALPPDLQPEVALRVIDAGKHVLAQKPLAVSFGEAERVVRSAEARGVTLAVNQNGRWDPSINAARTLIRGGVLGERLTAQMTMRISMPWQDYYQQEKYNRLMVLHMSVHHIDQMRWLFGDPSAVFAHGRKVPGQPFHGETIAEYTMFYDDGFFATSHDDGTNWSNDLSIRYRVQGSEAVLVGEIGWPHLTYSTLKIQRKGDGAWIEPRFSRMWFPDAFSATMGELICAIEGGRPPANSGADNLGTMRAVFAAYRAMSERRVVGVDEINASDD